MIGEIMKRHWKRFGDRLEKRSPAGSRKMILGHPLLYNPVSWDRTSRVFIPLSIFAKAPKIDADGKPPYAKINLLSDPSVEFIAQPIAAEPEELSTDARRVVDGCGFEKR